MIRYGGIAPLSMKISDYFTPSNLKKKKLFKLRRSCAIYSASVTLTEQKCRKNLSNLQKTC